MPSSDRLTPDGRTQTVGTGRQHPHSRLSGCQGAGLDPHSCQEDFLSLVEGGQVVDTPLIEGAKDEALKRIRDPADWPALALVLQLECAIGTEDQDFFGTGVATWTTATVEGYFEN